MLRTETLSNEHLSQLVNIEGLPYWLKQAEGYSFFDGDKCVMALALLGVGGATIELVFFKGEVSDMRFSLRGLKRQLFDYVLVHNIIRVQAVTEDTPFFRRWMGFMDFKEESILKRMANGQDRVMWVKFREDII